MGQARRLAHTGAANELYDTASADHHVAWRARGRLADPIDTLPFDQPPDAVASRLESAIEDVRQAVADMRAGPREAGHYER